MKKAVFPGSFDPITKGHENIALRALSLFDHVVIAIGENATKKSLFPIEQRLQFLKKTFHSLPKIEITTFQGLTVDFCKQEGAQFIIRGLRSAQDFEFERSIGQSNKVLNNGIETVFLIALPEYSHISSSIVRDIMRNGGDITAFIPSAIIPDI